MPFREVGMSLHAIQGRDSKVVGINVEIVISVRGAFQEMANEFMNFDIFRRVRKPYISLNFRKRMVLKKVVLFGVGWCSGEFGGADPLGSSQGVPRGGRFSYPVGPGSGFQGRGCWGQLSHDRQIGFPWTPQDGHMPILWAQLVGSMMIGR